MPFDQEIQLSFFLGSLARFVGVLELEARGDVKDAREFIWMGVSEVAFHLVKGPIMDRFKLAVIDDQDFIIQWTLVFEDAIILEEVDDIYLNEISKKICIIRASELIFKK